MSRTTRFSVLIIMAVVALVLSTAEALPLETRQEHTDGKCWGSVVGNVRYCPYDNADAV
ncbi:unnamed protein product [Mortierella alpina]